MTTYILVHGAWHGDGVGTRPALYFALLGRMCLYLLSPDWANELI
ncbi:MAG: hypothetical protein Ct9H300mP11_06530 [Chloroflexota bacterium]|nr:MAG: hypothetical protein Ct9H300mP11_06530 [Chloroflexota bacterium]